MPGWRRDGGAEGRGLLGPGEELVEPTSGKPVSLDAVRRIPLTLTMPDAQSFTILLDHAAEKFRIDSA